MSSERAQLASLTSWSFDKPIRRADLIDMPGLDALGRSYHGGAAPINKDFVQMDANHKPETFIIYETQDLFNTVDA
jgi:hypothetical protein